MRAVARARASGNDLFNAGKFAEACSAYGEGLGHDPTNPILYCNRAACRSKLGQWERSVDDCNHALEIRPNYTKALLRRAASNSKVFSYVPVIICLFTLFPSAVWSSNGDTRYWTCIR